MIDQQLLTSSFETESDLSQKLDLLNHDVQIFDAKTLFSLEWPKTEEGQQAQKFLTPLVQNGLSAYIDNIQADIFVLKVQQLVLPVVVVNENYQNAYICSPYGHYIAYGEDKITLIENRFLQPLLKFLIQGIGKISRLGRMDSVVYVNHGLFSTDLYPANLSSSQISAITTYLTQRFPQHVIAFRSLNSLAYPDLLQSFKNLKFHLLASRYVHLTHTENEAIFNTRILKSDLKLWRETPYQILDETQISPSVYPQLLTLYNQLYLSHHAQLNPRYNQNFVNLLLNEKYLRFKILKLNDSIKGVAGYLERDGVMHCPFFGYDKEDSEHNVIHRLLNTALLLEARKQHLIFHQSAGATFYKTIRRAEGCMEFTALYTRHLLYRQKLFWSLFKNFINWVAPPYMKKY